MHIGKHKCATVIDVDDKHENELSIFDLRDLWQALNDVVSECWLKEGHNGSAYADSQVAWAGS